MSKNDTIWRGTVRGGKIQFENPEQFAIAVAQLEGKPVTLTLKKFFFQRSINANKLYWSYLRDIVQETDGIYTEDRANSLHQYFRRQLLPPVEEKVKLPNGKVITFLRPKSTTELDSQQFSAYLKAIEMLTGVAIDERQ